MSRSSIVSLRGTLYSSEAVGEIAKVIAPPYDVIDERAKRALLERSPYNIVRLILPQPGGAPDFWNDSAALFAQWKREGVMAVDKGPCIYVYRQTFDHPARGPLSRTGILAAVKCMDFASGKVLPHERTFPRTRTERLNLLRACRANFSQIFMVYRDPEGEVLEFLEKAVSAEPFLAFDDFDGVRHELWRVEDADGGEEIARRLEGRRLIIADGHHRYETALAYGKEDAAAYEAGHPRAFVSAVLFRSEDPGLLVLPVHRVLRRCPVAPLELVRRLKSTFEVEEMAGDACTAPDAEKPGVGMGERRATSFIVLTRDGSFRLTLRKDVDAAGFSGGSGSERWRRLDVNVLHSLVFGDALGVDAGKLAEGGELIFTPWEDGISSAMERGEVDMAFLVRPTSMDEIWDIAEGGERMPHKSSYFHPKLPSGLVVYDHETAFE